jgi:hypothetical protein
MVHYQKAGSRESDRLEDSRRVVVERIDAGEGLQSIINAMPISNRGLMFEENAAFYWSMGLTVRLSCL